MSEKAAVLNALAPHRGAGNGISAEKLALIVGISERRVRTHISDLRSEGSPICGHPSEGYYIAATAEEIQKTCAYLHARAIHSLTLESRLSNIPLPVLIGQLRIPD